ncbi:MAG: hypothetical protein AABZ53_04230, partial [Planctomycetota bacterium]
MTRSASNLARTGLTMLEVVFAMALLGLVATTSMAALSYVHKSHSREQKTLAASEIASRLILMYIDDPQSPDKEGELIEWINGQKYRYKLDHGTVNFTSAVPAPDDAPKNVIGLDAIHIVKVRVWLSEESGGSLNFTPNAPYAVLTRIVDPWVALTRPDSTQRMADKYGRSAVMEYARTGQFPGTAPAPKDSGADTE